MAATYVQTTDSNYSRELINALNMAKILGLTETVIGAITSTGTRAKLRAKIAALTVSDSDAQHIRHVLSVFDKAVTLSLFTDANVESARAASSGSRFTTLTAAIVARADGVVAGTTTDFQF